MPSSDACSPAIRCARSGLWILLAVKNYTAHKPCNHTVQSASEGMHPSALTPSPYLKKIGRNFAYSVLYSFSRNDTKSSAHLGEHLIYNDFPLRHLLCHSAEPLRHMAQLT